MGNAPTWGMCTLEAICSGEKDGSLIAITDKLLHRDKYNHEMMVNSLLLGLNSSGTYPGGEER